MTSHSGNATTTSGNDEDTTDRESVLQDYRAFMLGDSRKKGSKNGTTPMTNKSRTTPASPRRPPKMNSHEPPSPLASLAPPISRKAANAGSKKFNSILRAYCSMLQRDWLEVDDNLCQVVRSIAHLRDRCWLVSQTLAAASAEDAAVRVRATSTTNGEATDGSMEWKMGGYGYRRPPVSAATRLEKNTSSLLRDDLDLALSHDLLEHERMMSGVRRLVGCLGQAQEALGHRYGELYEQYLLEHARRASSSSAAASDDHDEDPLSATSRDKCHSHHQDERLEQMAATVEACLVVFKATALELYRKQVSTDQLVVESVHDGLLLFTNDDDNNDGDQQRDIRMIHDGNNHGMTKSSPSCAPVRSGLASGTGQESFVSASSVA